MKKILLILPLLITSNYALAHSKSIKECEIYYCIWKYPVAVNYCEESSIGKYASLYMNAKIRVDAQKKFADNKVHQESILAGTTKHFDSKSDEIEYAKNKIKSSIVEINCN